MTSLPRPPSQFKRFVQRFPQAGEAWTLLQEQGADGPLDEPAQRLAKLGIAIGSGRPGAVHSAVRKAIAVGIELEAMEQVVALAAATIGMPASVAVHGWVLEEWEKRVQAS